MKKTPQEVVDDLNDLLLNAPKLTNKLFRSYEVLDAPYEYAEKMCFVCSINDNKEVELGPLGIINGILSGSGYRIGCIVKHGSVNDQPSIVEFCLLEGSF